MNRDRIYDFYAKEAEYFAKLPETPAPAPVSRADGSGRDGHWGNQNDDVWIDNRWRPDRPGVGGQRACSEGRG